MYSILYVALRGAYSVWYNKKGMAARSRIQLRFQADFYSCVRVYTTVHHYATL